MKQSIKEYLASIDGVDKVYDVNEYDTDPHGQPLTWWVSLRYKGQWQSGVFIPSPENGAFPPREYIAQQMDEVRSK